MAEEEQVNGAPAADDATSTPAPQDTTHATDADDEEIDYDAVAPEDDEAGADESDADEADDEEADNDEEEGSEYTTGAPPGDVERNSGLGAAAGQPELADALGALPPQDNSERAEVHDGRDYELIFIARSTAADAIDEITQNIRVLIEGREGAVDHIRQSELRRLAYPIKKETEGYYVVINGRFRPDTLPDLERQLKLEDRILRYMVIRQDG